MGGWGLKRLTLAEVEVTESIGGMTTSVSNQAIKAAVGGGNGFSLGYAWAPVRYFEFGVLLSAQFSPLAKKDVGEAKGSFFKAIDTAGAALRVPLGTSSRGQFQNGKPIWTDTTWLIGGGGGVSRADATINLTAIENGTSSKAEYGFSPVWYVGTGIEFAERAGRGRGLGFGMRLTYHDVTYDLEKVTEADQEVPLELVRPELRRVKGNAINLNLIVAGLL